MSAANHDLYVEQGATFRLSLVYGRKDGTLDVDGNPVIIPYDLTGCQIRTQIRQRRGSEVLISATTQNEGIAIDDDPTTGRMTITFSREATNSLNLSRAKYDIEVQFPSMDVVRIMQGNVKISGNITQDADLANVSPGDTGDYDLDEQDVPGPV